MNDVLLLYLFTRLNVLLAAAGVVIVVTAVGLVFACMERYVEWGSGKWPKFLRPTLAAFCVSAATVILVPDQRSLALMVGGKIALDAALSPDAQEISGLVVEQIKDVLRRKE